MQESSELFNGVGKLKDTTIKLHIDENVSSVAQLARLISFHVRKALNRALTELEEHDTTEPSLGATYWVSPFVVFPKLNNPTEVHACIISRGITNFAIHYGLYPYRRLSFGISSTAKIFQYQIQTAISGILGCRNLSDHIIVYGKTHHRTST